MKKRIKGDSCLNCNHKLGSEVNYCPNCGQENNTVQLSFSHLVKDFFSNYISLDSRFGRTFKPFVIKPGSLTKVFMDGKRVSFANPIRWYLVISLLHFFALTQVSKIFSDEEQKIFKRGKTSNPGISLTIKNDTVPIATTDLGNLSESDTLNSDDDDLISDQDMDLMEKMIESGYSRTEILDSLNINDRPFWRGLFLKQTVKLSMDDQKSLNIYILQNVPILMFILLPLYALVLKLFFRKRLYINHLIHSIYIHSFFFFVMTFYWIAAFFFSSKTPEVLNISVFLLLIAHNFLSFKKLYDVKWFRAISSLFLSGFIYTILLVIGMVCLVIVSLLLF